MKIKISKKEVMKDLLDVIKGSIENTPSCRQERELERLLDRYEIKEKERKIARQYSFYLHEVHQRLLQQSPFADRMTRIAGIALAVSAAGGIGYLGGYLLQGENQAAGFAVYTSCAGGSLELVLGPFYEAIADCIYGWKKKRYEEECVLIKENAQLALEEDLADKL